MLQQIWNKFLLLEESEMDPQEGKPFSKFQRGSHICPCPRLYHTSLQEQIRVADTVLQS